uniref:Ig-like domain-containing protein n=1 Tax=Poecilia formosa TaxID=48698 RepID=A0A096MEG1_POEFO
ALKAYLLFKFTLSYICTENNFEVKTVTTGQNVNLSCPRQTSALYQETLYWIRLVSGNWPEFLGATFNFEFDEESNIPRIQTKQEQGEFLLIINEAYRNDTGLYYCVKVRQLDFIFMNGTFLQIRAGEESNVTVLLKDFPSGAIQSETQETLQCSVLSYSERKTCPADHRVYWFKAGSDHSHPNLLYLQENSGDECKRIPETASAQKCFYNFSETSDAGIYNCAVAACGQILFGNEAKRSGIYESFLNHKNLIFNVFFPTFNVSLILISWLIYKIKKKKCGCCNGPATITGDNQSQKVRREENLVYSAPTFNKNRAKKGERRNVRTAQEETVYTDVRTFR